MWAEHRREKFRRQFVVLLVRFFRDRRDRAAAHRLDECLQRSRVGDLVAAIAVSQPLLAQMPNGRSHDRVGNQAAFNGIEAEGEKAHENVAQSFHD